MAQAAWRVYKIEKKRRGVGDTVFLKRVFQKLLLNFTWWVNRKDADGMNIFQGGFLGLDNIGVFDRSAPLPTGGHIAQSDGTSWMAMYALNLLAIAMELAKEDPSYEDVASKFWEHFLSIARAMTDDTYFERGINLRHGYMGEYYVDDAEFIVKIPQGLKEVGVLLEPTTVVEKGIAQAYEIQRCLRVWRPKRAGVMGAGTIGLLATLVLRLRGLQVTTFGLAPKPYLNSGLIEAIDATYQSTKEMSIIEGAKKYGPFDIIFEATGFSPVVFESMQALGKNGVLVLSSVTGGDRKIEVPADKINLDFVLGNKVMVGTVNANREYFEMGVKDMAQAEAEYPGWLSRLLTHPFKGLEKYKELFDKLTNANGAIKVFCEVAEL
jgi:threonine dehydrogenase-like Zn-dependent dehydrogenase